MKEILKVVQHYTIYKNNPDQIRKWNNLIDHIIDILHVWDMWFHLLYWLKLTNNMKKKRKKIYFDDLNTEKIRQNIWIALLQVTSPLVSKILIDIKILKFQDKTKK